MDKVAICGAGGAADVTSFAGATTIQATGGGGGKAVC